MNASVFIGLGFGLTLGFLYFSFHVLTLNETLYCFGGYMVGSGYAYLDVHLREKDFLKKMR